MPPKGDSHDTVLSATSDCPSVVMNLVGSQENRRWWLQLHMTCAAVLQEIWPAETTPVEGNKDALDSAFLPSADADMQDIMVGPCNALPLSSSFHAAY